MFNAVSSQCSWMGQQGELSYKTKSSTHWCHNFKWFVASLLETVAVVQSQTHYASEFNCRLVYACVQRVSTVIVVVT